MLLGGYMIEIFDVGKFNTLHTLHDSVSSSLELNNNIFIMTFDRICEESEKTKNANKGEKLCVKYILNFDFKKWDKLIKSVTNIDYRKKRRKKIIRYFTLKGMIKELDKHHQFLSIQSQYYRTGRCLLCTEVYSNGRSEAGNMYYIELLVDKIIYEWQ